MALHGLTLVINQRLARDIERYETTVDLRVVPPPCPVRCSPADFSQSDDLIQRSREVTRPWRDARGSGLGQSALLMPHSHD